MTDLSRVAVVVPSLHPSRDVLFPFIEGVRSRGFTEVVVVDDGSGPEYAAVYDELASQFGCVILRHEHNQGKGRALKTAFTHCAEMAENIDVVVTADSDGQHAPDDLARVAERTQDLIALGRQSAVLGSRTFDAATVPRNSRIGNKLTSSIVRAFFGRYLPDTQTGLRGFPLALALQTGQVKGERFDYEMNVLLWLLSTRTEIDEVPIETIYHDLQNTVSHFRPVVDSARVYAVIIRQLAKFTGVSLLSAVADIAIYIVLLDWVFGPDRHPGQVASAVVIARLISSLFNYALNKRLVFHDNSRPAPSLLRYYSLAAVILLGSALGTTALSSISDGHDVWAKVIVDLLLFIASYFIQERWVFRDRTLEQS